MDLTIHINSTDLLFDNFPIGLHTFKYIGHLARQIKLTQRDMFTAHILASFFVLLQTLKNLNAIVHSHR